MLEACASGDFEGICKYAGNVFEQVIEVVERIAKMESASPETVKAIETQMMMRHYKGFLE